MQDDMADMMADMEEINEMMTRNFALPEGCDDMELEGEFAALEEELKMEDLEKMMAGGSANTTSAGESMPSYLPEAAKEGESKEPANSILA